MSALVLPMQRLVQAGWAPEETASSDVAFVGPRLPTAPGSLLAVLPTIASRFADPASAQLRTDIVAQLGDLEGAALLIAVQRLGADRDATARALLRTIEALSASIAVSGVVLEGPGKLHSTNIAIAEAERTGAAGLLLLDDDVALEPQCLPALSHAFRRGSGPRAVGARKMGQPHHSWSGRALHALKSLTQPATNYPHGCCMAVATEVLHGGLPTHHHSDDGQILFRLLDPAAANPLHALTIVDDARCHHVVGGRFRAVIARLNRMLHHHAIAMADASPDKAVWYFRHSLFFGLWPLAPFDGSRGVPRGLAKLVVKAIYFVWFTGVVAKLAARGLSGRPQRGVAWGGRAERA